MLRKTKEWRKKDSYTVFEEKFAGGVVALTGTGHTPKCYT